MRVYVRACACVVKVVIYPGDEFKIKKGDVCSFEVECRKNIGKGTYVDVRRAGGIVGVHSAHKRGCSLATMRS